mmetsp:Transcript_67275/g.140127  ORF Transcript_67275/g.140127 Transcript_67275/m.140127 type:complete len:408 (+) Transcript_67275:58-1281(+)|eukprot:CAMPEP_0181290516 /NCGR_PEP_ID=MMETSP1101-20121128/1455_1 /TAXON_ID=46948 /ORGANISM="Rhodomonas abbreviata, Strain Caron Lab Isolate" /LENGTH=407 /DNA_ID=CAMNT_0023394805 /DNA_START=113 /DNA_END=1336 /DNA_ORIENTATION=+
MPKIVVPAATIKSHQRLVAVKAGLDTCERKTMTAGEMHIFTMNAYNRHAKLLFETDGAPPHLNVELLLRKTADHLFTGKEIWDLYLDTKRDCTNIFNLLWNAKINSDGTLPSGKDKETILAEILNEMWMEKEEERVANLLSAADEKENAGEGSSDNSRKNAVKTEIQPWPDDWQQLSWLAFVTLGIQSENPKTQLVTASGSGQQAPNPNLPKRDVLSRQLQRKQEKRELLAEKEEKRDTKQLNFITAVISALKTLPSQTQPVTPVTPTPKADAEMSQSDLIRMRELHRAELQQWYNMAEGDDKELARNALLNFLRDPMDAMAKVSTPVRDRQEPRQLFCPTPPSVPPPPPPNATDADEGASVDEDKDKEAAGGTKVGAKRKQPVAAAPSLSQKPVRQTIKKPELLNL